MSKKMYAAPKIFKVDLNANQAILALCKIGQGAQLSTRSSNRCATNCRRARANAAGQDSGARAS